MEGGATEPPSEFAFWDWVADWATLEIKAFTAFELLKLGVGEGGGERSEAVLVGGGGGRNKCYPLIPFSHLFIDSLVAPLTRFSSAPDLTLKLTTSPVSTVLFSVFLSISLLSVFPPSLTTLFKLGLLSF